MSAESRAKTATLARSDRARDDLWRRSAVMVGLDA